MIPDPSPPFTVEMSGSARDQLAAILRRATQLQLSAELIPVLTDISERLRTDPRGWGDPLRNLRHLHLTFYRGILHPCIVYFSVHNRIPLVSVWHFKIQPGHPLAPPDNGR